MTNTLSIYNNHIYTYSSNIEKLIPYAQLIMEEHLGRLLASDEVVHHKDNNKLNNDLSNLEVMSRRKHTALHRSGKKHTEEQKLAWSQSRSGVNCSERHRQRQSEASARVWRERRKAEEMK